MACQPDLFDYSSAGSVHTDSTDEKAATPRLFAIQEPHGVRNGQHGARGVEVEFVPTDWKTLVNGVVAGQYHITGSASISPARMKAAGFSESYISVEIVPFTAKENAGKFDGHEAINQTGVKVATTLGTTFEKLVRTWYPNADIRVCGVN